MSGVVLILGRDGVENGETIYDNDFDRWVEFVASRIDARCGFDVEIRTRGARDVQTDEIRGGGEDQQAIVDAAKADLWDDWCSGGAR